MAALGASPACRRDAPPPGSVDATVPTVAVDPTERAEPSTELRLERFEVRSELLSTFAGQDVLVRAMVVTPRGYDPNTKVPALFSVHGFGGSADSAGERAMQHLQTHPESADRALLRVFIDGNHTLGHHEFADSAVMGPWGAALTTEFLPLVDARYGVVAGPRGHFVSGHSSGGWSSLWLQVTYPDVFGGVWSTAPDPVDFRDFVGVDIYRFDNAYRTPTGETIQLEYRDGKAVRSLRQFVIDERKRRPVGGQMDSFDAVFSPRKPDGNPALLFDRDTGAIDPDVAQAWRGFDISLLLRTEWARRGPGLRGKVRVFVGTQDTFGLHRPVRLLADALGELGSDAQFVFVEGRNHFDLYQPHPEHYPAGLRDRIERELLAESSGP